MGTITIMDPIMTTTIEVGMMIEIGPEKDLEKNLEIEHLEKNLEIEPLEKNLETEHLEKNLGIEHLEKNLGIEHLEKNLETELPMIEGKTGMTRDIMTLAMVGTAEVSARRP